MRRNDGASIIALTLRHDRIDNFWFTLLHEFAHVVCHLSEDLDFIVDDLEIRSAAYIEDEADRFAQDALIPSQLWLERSSTDFDVSDVVSTAFEAGVHPAIIAGRWQREHRITEGLQNYSAMDRSADNCSVSDERGSTPLVFPDRIASWQSARNERRREARHAACAGNEHSKDRPAKPRDAAAYADREDDHAPADTSR
jgi:HTH-type transcriptional regulator/antitoxin HigA